MKEFILLLLGVAVVFLVVFLKSAREDALYRGYERGAHLIAVHHKCRGNYGSYAFRRFALKWGDPQTCHDIEEIYRMLDEGGEEKVNG